MTGRPFHDGWDINFLRTKDDTNGNNNLKIKRI